MDKVVGVRFKPTGKIYDFDCGPFVVDIGDEVIVTTDRGLGFAVVASPPVPLSERTSTSPLKKVYRLANEEDIQRRKKNIRMEEDAFEFCSEQVAKLDLTMNLFSVESTFDASKMTFFFTADGRVDFRELVKILVKQFKTRIEMRQVGIRNQAKMCGGIGRCGREICCSSFIDKFDPVSIRMAKKQGLSLNPTKISGLCGRLMCCLTFEDDTYRRLKEDFPKTGKIVKTESGDGKVIRHNVIGGKITVRLEDGKEFETPVDKVSYEKPPIEKKSRKPKPQKNKKEDD
jgi:cell fate regulator YaaT (PSP1 superfamily)